MQLGARRSGRSESQPQTTLGGWAPVGDENQGRGDEDEVFHHELAVFGEQQWVALAEHQLGGHDERGEGADQVRRECE